ncbi:MAG: hypothetical protein ACRYG6_07665 [Janthinobacterium lividum]
MRRNARLGLMLVCATGCTPTTWYKPGASQQDFTTTSYECERDARQSGYFGLGLSGAIEMASFQNRCMGAHGYSRLDAQEASAAQASDVAYSTPVDPAVEARVRVQASDSCASAGLKTSDPGYYACFTNGWKARLRAEQAQAVYTQPAEFTKANDDTLARIEAAKACQAKGVSTQDARYYGCFSNELGARTGN